MEQTQGCLSESRLIRVLGALLCVAGLLANPWFLAGLKHDGQIGFGSALLIVLAELLMVFLGGSLLLCRHKAAIFRSTLVAVSLGLWTLVLLAASELYLALTPKTKSSYQPFRVQHLHPFYLFSLPSDATELARINSAVVSVTPGGFRGPGPEQRGDRKLAFVLGGSAAFGDGASGDRTTISGYLNEAQKDYHFVNAGVPSWNSTQEFYRLAMQLLHYQPQLIVVYNGYNDVAINRGYRETNMPVPPGTPESYEHLSRWVDDIRLHARDPLLKFNPAPLYALTFPRTRSHIGKDMEGVRSRKSALEDHASKQPISMDAVDKDAASYLWNIGNMERLAAARGARLVVFWQATSLLHRTTPAERQELGDRDKETLEYWQRFHRYVMEHRDERPQVHDFGNLFDRYAGRFRLVDLFTDPVHLTDQGNRIVADEIWSRISAPAGR